MWRKYEPICANTMRPVTKHLPKLTLSGQWNQYRNNYIRLKRDANADLIPSELRWWHVSGGVTLVHKRSDELAAVLSRQLALKKPRHRFTKGLGAKQRRNQQHGQYAGHRRCWGWTNEGRSRYELNHQTTRRARQAKKPNRLTHQGGGEAIPEVIAWPLRNKTRWAWGCCCTVM